MKAVFSEEIKRKMLKGVDVLADSVESTLGPLGRNTAMYQKENLRDAEYSDPRKYWSPMTARRLPGASFWRIPWKIWGYSF